MRTLQDVPETKAMAVSSGEKLSLERKGMRNRVTEITRNSGCLSTETADIFLGFLRCREAVKIHFKNLNCIPYVRLSSVSCVSWDSLALPFSYSVVSLLWWSKEGRSQHIPGTAGREDRDYGSGILTKGMGTCLSCPTSVLIFVLVAV